LVKAKLTNPQGTSRPWQVSKVRLDWDKSLKLTLPPTAVTHMAGQDFVFVVVSDKAGKHVAQRPVKLGSIQDNRYVVLEGLKPKEMVVIEGGQKLQDKAPVTIMPNQKPPLIQ
jgi:multidrug efflux pump subunit AcrA (membrane-fusion protein)